MASTLDGFYYQTKITIDFWYRQELKLKSLFQPSETLPVDLTRTHNIYIYIYIYTRVIFSMY